MSARATSPRLSSTRYALIPALLALGACGSSPLEVLEIDPATLDDGLVAHWTFDEGSGDIVLDHSGNGHDGKISGAGWIADGRFGGAIHIDEGAFVSIDNFPGATSNWSVSAWVRVADAPPSDDAFRTVISTEELISGGWEMNIDRSMTEPGAHFGYWEGSEAADYYRLTCFCMTLNKWNHIVASVDAQSGALSLYVNGALGASLPVTHTIIAGSATLYMGKWTGDGRLLVGDLDDILVYHRALVPAEVATLSRSSPPDVR